MVTLIRQSPRPVKLRCYSVGARKRIQREGLGRGVLLTCRYFTLEMSNLNFNVRGRGSATPSTVSYNLRFIVAWLTMICTPFPILTFAIRPVFNAFLYPSTTQTLFVQTADSH